ncbi:MAG: hypothetical protein AB4911_06360 [Oscillochloridaceae bacterium umkhey_bin13]
MVRETAVSRWSARIAEACWLLALTLVPLYFNLYSARHFEPDKAAVLRSLALIALAAVVVRAFDQLVSKGERRDGAAKSAGPPFWRRLAAIPLLIPTTIYAGVFVLTTITSVVPATSWWGSYQRLQGTYTHLSYILIFVALLAVVRQREQIERIITITLATSVAVAGYGVMQHFSLDPLPWRGDVITRVASTMGNSIFVAAYMIMVVPPALYRLFASLSDARQAPPAAKPQTEWLWLLTRGLLFGGGLLLMLAMLKFGAVIRVADHRYWWLLPGAISVTTALWWLLTIGLGRGEQRTPFWPGVLALGYVFIFSIQFALSSGSGVQALATDGTAARAQDWWLWLGAAIVLLTAGYGLALSLPRMPIQPSMLALRVEAVAAGLITLLLGVAIVFSQSRGPWLGLGAGLFIFFTLLLWQALRHAQAQQLLNQVRLFRSLLAGWVVLALAAAAFLVVFNLSDAPVFNQLRELPYLGRMGRLLEVDEGTGLVRRLIWVGDEHAGGAVALISSDPVRAVIGWGPESMFVAFNPHYPPSLANIEARGASPDRAHQALLDDLATRGLLGLLSYTFLLGSFAVLAWRLMRQSSEWRWQLFFMACLATVTTTFVEGLTGIPIVSSLMMFWVTLGLTVTGGAVAGHYRLSLAPAPPEPTPAVEASPVAKGAQAGRRKGQPRSNLPRGTPARTTRGSTNSGALLGYALIAMIAFGLITLLNVNPIRADMRFQQGQSFAERGSSSPDLLVQALSDYLATVRLNPREDFYYLNLGRVLMSLADLQRNQGVDPGQPRPDATVEDLLRYEDAPALFGFIQRSSPNELMSYAEAVLQRAHDLNPRNKDHYANLGRLNSFWYQWTGDASRLEQALTWYEQVGTLAPQDVTLINERANVLVQLGQAAAIQGDTAQADQYFAQAATLLQRSGELDPRYADTFVRLGDLARTADQDLDAATAAYVQAIGVAPQLVANSIETIAAELAQRPDLIKQLRDAYAQQTVLKEQALVELRASGADPAAAEAELALLHTVVGLLGVRAGETVTSVESYQRAVELQPASLIYSRNYAIVLSDTQRLGDAIAEMQRLITVLQSQPGSAATLAEAERLAALFAAAAGQ